MSPAASPLIDDTNVEIVRARIDTEDHEFAAPIREFLEEFGCQVVVNGTPRSPAVYHVICGGRDFVKELLENEAPAIAKRLAIIWNGNGQELTGYERGETKIVLTDPKPPAPALVTDIFSFFFTSAAAVLDLRTRPPGAVTAPQPLPVLIEEPRRDLPPAPLLPEEDKKRIQSMIAVLFPGADIKKKEKHKKRKYAGRVAAAALIVAVLAAPFMWYAAAVTLAGLSFVSAAKFLEQGKPNPASWATVLGQTFTRQSRTALAIAGSPFQLAGLGNRLRSWERLVSFLSDVGAGQEELLTLTGDANALALVLLGSQGGSGSVGSPPPAVRLAALRRSVSAAANRLGLAQAQLDQMLSEQSFPFSWVGARSFGQRAAASLSRVRQQITLADELLTVYPALAGFDRRKTYLLLFQNSAELRPTGGFIGSIAAVSAENGTVVDLTVQDVYGVDGQLKGHVDPPQPVRELLAQEHWYLRDSNWDPDFRVSGAAAAWFYEKETGTSVDGVVAITTGLISDLLRATGPLDLPDYPDRITADNFLGKAIFYTQSDFFPGSTQKKDFLGTVTRTMLTAVTSGKRVESPLLFSAIARGLASRDIQLFITDSTLQALIEHFGWSGRVFAKDGCAGQVLQYCLFDPLAIAEANVSVNKANAFIKRSRMRQVVLGEDGKVAETVTISYTNPSRGPPQDAGGSYRAYLQFLLPSDAADVSVTVGASAVPERRARQAAAVPYWESSGAGRIGVAVDVPPGGQMTVSFFWRRGTGLVFGRDGGVYELFDQKQAGITDDTFRTIIRYPIFWQTLPDAYEGNTILPAGRQAFLAKEAQLEYNTPLSGDAHIRIRFTK